MKPVHCQGHTQIEGAAPPPLQTPNPSHTHQEAHCFRPPLRAGPKREELKGGDFDCRDIPDAAMTLAVVAAFANSRTIIRNVGSWRVKETERMKAIVTELGKLGVKVGFPQCN